jgi:hypothetical protein
MGSSPALMRLVIRDVVRAGLISHPKFVTNDPVLGGAINSCQALHLTALTPQEAVQFASELCKLVQ